MLPAPGIADRVVQHVTQWLASGHHDDIAVLVVQAPIPVHRPAGRHLHSVQTARTHAASAHPAGPRLDVDPVSPEEVP